MRIKFVTLDECERYVDWHAEDIPRVFDIPIQIPTPHYYPLLASVDMSMIEAVRRYEYDHTENVRMNDTRWNGMPDYSDSVLVYVERSPSLEVRNQLSYPGSSQTILNQRQLREEE